MEKEPVILTEINVTDFKSKQINFSNIKSLNNNNLLVINKYLKKDKIDFESGCHCCGKDLHTFYCLGFNVNSLLCPSCNKYLDDKFIKEINTKNYKKYYSESGISSMDDFLKTRHNKIVKEFRKLNRINDIYKVRLND